MVADDGPVNSLAHENARYETPAAMQSLAPAVTKDFIDNLEALRRSCDERGIHLVVANQQVTSHTIPPERIRTTSYRQEVEEVRTRVAETRETSSNELKLLGHARLMDAMRDWVNQQSVGYVDAIEVLDRDRDVLVSGVHLNARGNRLLASALAGEILARTCSAAGRSAYRPLRSE